MEQLERANSSMDLFSCVNLKTWLRILTMASSLSYFLRLKYRLYFTDGTKRHSAVSLRTDTSLHSTETGADSLNACSYYIFMNSSIFLPFSLFISWLRVNIPTWPESRMMAAGLLLSRRQTGSDGGTLQQQHMSRIYSRRVYSQMGLKKELHWNMQWSSSKSAGVQSCLSLRNSSAIIILFAGGMIKQKMKFELVDKLLKEHHYKPIKAIGAGSFGEVFLIEDAQGNLLAAKAISKTSLKKKYISQEINIMSQLNHPNLVKNYLCLKSDFFLVLINEYCNNDNLLHYQAKLPNKRVPLNQILLIVADILRGLKYMHDLGFIHRDIKAENILIDDNPVTSTRMFKIADFGFARSISTSSAKTLCGTEKYMAPEVLSRQVYGEGADVWSLGVLIYFMLFSEFPFRGYDMKAQIKKKCIPEFSLNAYDCKPYKNHPVESLLKQIFTIDKEKRIKVSEIPLHPLFADLKEKLVKDLNLETDRPSNEIKASDEEEPEAEAVVAGQVESESEIQPEDETNSLLTLKERVAPNERHLEREFEEIKFQIDKVQYLKESARNIFETYKDYFNYTERIAARYYLLKVFLVYGKPLLESLQKSEMPASLRQADIDYKKWVACTLSPEYEKLVNKLRYMIAEVESNYEDTFFYASRIQKQILLKNFDHSFKQEIESCFDDVKLSFRSVTAFYFGKIRSIQYIEPGLKIKMQMRIFCCHAINRVFKRNEVSENFPYYISWLKKNKISYDYSLDLVYFKKWVLTDEADNLKQNLKILIDKYF